MNCLNKSSKFGLHIALLLIIVNNLWIQLIYAGTAPTISEHPLDILVVRGDPATLRCASTGENVEIKWFKDEQRVIYGKHRLLLPNGSLFLLKVNNGGTDSDAGTYYCEASNEFGSVRSQEANVRIALLRDDFRVNPHPVQALIGSTAILECSSPKGFPEPVITWHKDEKELDRNDETRYKFHPSGNLIIENVQRSDSGSYQCIAGNMVGERVSKPARLSVFEKPRFLTVPKDMIADVNTSVLFDCRVVGEPMPSISWKKLNDQMPIGRAYVTRDSRGLRIDKITPEDSGEYVCYAKNPVGNIEAMATLKVNSPPIFTRTPENVRVNAGKSIIFQCEASGQPKPGIFWSKEGDEEFTYFSGLASTDGRVQVTKEGRLIIDDVRSIDQGNYVCAAVNAAGSMLTKASLTVISNSNPVFPPPVIQNGHQNQTLMINDMAILPCQATSRVPSRITWLKNNQLLNLSSNTDDDDENRYRQLVSGNLQITDLRKSDTGVYTCRARNEDGEATWTASLIVEEHTNPNTIFQRMPDGVAFPSAPGKPLSLNVTENSIELEWSPPERHGASPIIGYLLQYWSPSLKESWINVMDVISNTHFRVKHLNPSHSYAFVVRAENSKGIGPPSPISDIITTKYSTSDVEKDRMHQLLDLEAARQKLAGEQLIKLQEVRPLNSTAMFLKWKRQRNEPLVQGYYIKWRGPPLSADNSWVNVTEAITEQIIISGLKPFNNYEFFVIPYHQSVQGMPSNSLDGTTFEAPPTAPPSDVRLRMLNKTSLRVSWRPPIADGINGILKGFMINIRSNQSEERNITTNERATSVTLYRLIQDASYTIRVAARTNAGFGVFYNAKPIVMNDETLRAHSEANSLHSWYKHPWVVLIIGIILWCILLLMIILLWYRCCHRQKQIDGINKDREFIKIRDGSVANNLQQRAAGAYWPTNTDAYTSNECGGCIATENGCIASNGTPHDACTYSDYGSGAGTLPHCAIRYGGGGGHCPGGHIAPPAASSTLQRRSQSPSHHYHYAQLPDLRDCIGNGGGGYVATSSVMSADNETLPTFCNHSQRAEYYDDPSPYATTTLNLNGMTCTTQQQQQQQQRQHPRHAAIQHNNHLQRLTRNTSSTMSHSHLNQHPALPLNPIPNEPPRNFLSTAAVVATTTTTTNYCQQNCNCNCNNNNNSNNNNNNISDCSPTLSCAHLDMLRQQHANSCGAIPESLNCATGVAKNFCQHFLKQQQKQQQHRSTAGNNENSFQRNSQQQHLQEKQQRHSTTYRPSGSSASNLITTRANSNTTSRVVANTHRNMNNKNVATTAATRRTTTNKSRLSDSTTTTKTTKQQQQSTSPYTDVSYIQSSDGTNGSSKAIRAIGGGGRNSPTPVLKNILDFVVPPPPPDDGDDDNIQNGLMEDSAYNSNNFYDPVATTTTTTTTTNYYKPEKSKTTTSFGYEKQQQNQRASKRNDRNHHRRSKPSTKSQVSLIEKDDNNEQGEHDPLMSYEAEFEADGELSEDESAIVNRHSKQQQQLNDDEESDDDEKACTSSFNNDDSGQIPTSAGGFTDEDGYFGTNYRRKSNKKRDSNYSGHDLSSTNQRKSTYFNENNNNNNNKNTPNNVDSSIFHQQHQRDQTIKPPPAPIRKPLMGVNTISQNSIDGTFNANILNHSHTQVR